MIGVHPRGLAWPRRGNIIAPVSRPRTAALAGALAALLLAAPSALAGAPRGISQTIPVGPDPIQVAAEGGSVWVLRDDGASERTLRRVDPRTLRLAGAPVRVGTFGSTAPFLGGNARRSPMVAAFGSAWVADAGSGAILRVSPGRGVVARIPIAGGPRDVAVGPGGLWVVSAGRALLRIDPRANAVAETRPFDTRRPGRRFGSRGPNELAVGAPGVLWLSAASPGRTLTRVDPSTGRMAEVGVGAWALGRGRTTLWLAERNACDLVSVRSSGVVRRLAGVLRLPGGRSCYPRGVAIGPRGNLWALLHTRAGRPGRVLGVEARTGRIEKRRTVGREPVAIAAGAGGVWVVNRADGTLTRFPTSTGRARAR